MVASFTNFVSVRPCNPYRPSLRRLPFLSLKRARKVHDQRIWERSEPRQANAPSRNSFSRAIILANFVLLAWSPATPAQSFNLTSPNHVQKDTVSVRELQIPVKARVALSRGVECMHKGDAARCLPHFRRAIQVFPAFYEAYYDQGVAQMELNEKDAALQSFQAAIDLSGGHFARGYFGYGIVLAQEGRSKDAESILRRGLEEDPTLSAGYAALSAVLLDEGQLDEAEESGQKALRMPRPSVRNALLTLAFIHIKKQEYPLAVQELESYLAAVRRGQFREDTGFVKYVEDKLSDAKAKTSPNAPNSSTHFPVAQSNLRPPA